MENKTPTTQHKLPSEKDFEGVNRIPFYFGDNDKPLLGWLHTTEKTNNSNQAMIICPSLALEYMNSYRAMRYVADYFAIAGIPTLRFDYHGTGDSSGENLDEDRLPDWIESIEKAYLQIKLITGVENVGMFGFRMGATLGVLAEATVPFNQMILWAPIEHGKRFIREIKTLQKTSAIEQSAQADILEAGGFVYWKQTEKAIQAINLFELTPKNLNILIIPRDDLPSNTKLLEHWNENCQFIEQLQLEGSSEVLIDAHLTKIPHQSIFEIVNWVVNNKNSLHNSLNPNQVLDISEKAYKLAKKCEFTITPNDPEGVALVNTDITEQILSLPNKNITFAIQTQPKKPTKLNLPVIIFSNSGTNHRVGPSRLYVQLARQLAAIGFIVLRIDLPGIGDNIKTNREQENIEYLDSGSLDILELTATLKDTLNNNNFVITGLCSGAYFSFHTALNSISNTICEVYLINPLTFYWDKTMTAETTPARNFSAWNWYKSALTSTESWKKLFKGKIDFISLLKTIFLRLKIKANVAIKPLLEKSSKQMAFDKSENTNDFRQSNNLGKDLKTISAKGTQLTFLFARSDPGFDLLQTLGGKSVKTLSSQEKLSITFIENADHTLSKFSPRVQGIKSILKHFSERYINS